MAEYAVFVSLILFCLEVPDPSMATRPCQDVLNIPPSHIPQFSSRFPEFCRFNNNVTKKCRCWGYEFDLPDVSTSDCVSFQSIIQCDRETDPYTKTDKKASFHRQGDFGYIGVHLRNMMSICEPRDRRESSLVCSENLNFCMARNLMIDLREIPRRRDEVLRYRMDVLKTGQIGGKCLLHEERLKRNLDQLSPLQSWAPELRFFKGAFNDYTDSIDSSECDVFIEKPTFIMKLDATVNMYHHFCDFLNLYASLHLNSTNNPHMYSKDVNIFIWENQEYSSSFAATWEAFTVNPLLNLESYSGQRVCFKNAVFPLLARRIYGLYYNTPLIDGCSRSRLFKAFSEFIPYRLGIIPVHMTNSRRIRVTIIARLTEHRRILNQRELVEALTETGSYRVTVARFTHKMDFKEQLRITTNTDILVGIHGAGLTHLLFLPDWAVIFEIYHCGDPSCYYDLARLRGVKHLTWSNETLMTPEDEGHHPTMKGAHAKFTNYSFDKDEFLRKIEEAALFVKSHPEFRALNTSPNEEVIPFHHLKDEL